MEDCGKSSAAAPTTILAPGFRFHPTDEELVWYYLRRKVSGKRFRLDAISEIDIYKVEPADLPGLSKLKSKDREWYFFSALDRKYGNGMRTNRATERGYWKTTGKDRPVHHNDCLVGMKKTLVYHFGRAPHGKRTDWVMHEYKLVDKVLENAGYPLEGYVLCRIFQKSGSGPKNGEQYGAKLVDEEWEDNNYASTTSVAGEVSFEDPYVDDDDDDVKADAFIKQNDLTQVLDIQIPQNAPLSDNFNSQGSQNCAENCINITGIDQKPSAGEHEIDSGFQALDDQMICDLIQAGSSNVVKNEYNITAPNNDCNQAALSLEDLFSNDVVNAPLDDGQYFDAAADFWDPAQFGSILDDDVDIAAFLNFDNPAEQIDANADLGSPAKQSLGDACWELPSTSELLQGPSTDITGASSNRFMDVPLHKPSKTASSIANRWLENIPAHPAFASEMPTKDMESRLTAVLESSDSVQVTGMIRIRDMNTPIGAGESGWQWSFDKTGNLSVLLSFDVPQTVSAAELESLSSISSSKFAAAASRGWMYFMFFWVFVFALSMKIGTCIYAK